MANSSKGRKRGKSGSAGDRDLGESRRIPRRDFLQGTLIAAATTLTGPLLEGCVQAASAATRAAQDVPGYYPPLLNGMRGSHPGSFETAHAMRDGKHWDSATDTGDSYDLIVVGGGMSGLAAAHFYRVHAGGKSRILILENHDDFGGHAKRNEFQLGGLMQLVNGGTYLIDSPRPYSAAAGGLIRELGIDVATLQPKIERPNFYRDLGLDAGVFFDRETFGADKLVTGVYRRPYRQVLADSPLPEQARADIERIEEGAIDFMPGLSSDELLGTSFAMFEHNIREELARTLGPGGFDPARDIAAITVNRWPHGYAPEYNPLWEPELPESQSPNVIGRAPFGRIHIANSDSGRAAYTDSAIDQAHRAVSESLAAT